MTALVALLAFIHFYRLHPTAPVATRALDAAVSASTIALACYAFVWLGQELLSH